MRVLSTIVIFLCLLPEGTLMAQLSPGKLTTAHAAYEGTLNCTLCHDLGKKVSNDKCLDCHDILQDRIVNNLGYHASSEVRGQDCFACHSEHHGRAFEMIRFDESAFDHNLAGYELTGSHATIDCRDCHQPEYIASTEIRKIDNTFLGLGTDCAACHEDYHQGTLDNDCASCHTTEAFAPADFFDHADTDFALRGAHQEVDCIDCHAMETRNGQDFQVFADIPFADCVACHEDVHANQLPGDCQSCHNEQSFNNQQSLSRYNHRLTRFPLEGAHRKVSCAACHQLDVSPVRLFQLELGTAPDDCVACHEDVHEGKFGENCAECHSVNSFTGDFNEASFNHGLTDFALEGKHQDVECAACHTTNLIDPLPFQQCTDCHTDYHEGAFVQAAGPVVDCASCHLVDGFEIVNYTIEQHNTTDFPLTGAHLATPCVFCHLPDQAEDWVFQDLGTTCVACHENIHQDEITAQYYPNEDCTQCHTTNNWVENNFDHNLTSFALEGKHASVNCRECHLDADTGQRVFAETSVDCMSCHTDVHYGQFADAGGYIDCASCHAPADWTAPYFDHDNAAFQLDGSHVNVACEQCHPIVADAGTTYVLYKTNQFACIDCHK